ncbi:MAG TPA: uroporphyrinogen decarboxylase [Casimicrobiaceae bacterium]|nr:uroporphyrinogen decarboxylase [Casimicrobiaceae bacterium]
MQPKNDTLLKALRREPTPYVPIWLMRQAGRYLPEYNATRSRAGSFLGLCRNPALATEVTLQPLERFPLDAAILFSDILTIPDAMGLGLAFVDGDGPRFEHPLADEAAIERLAVPDLAQLAYVFDAVASIKRALSGRVPLLGFAGSPFTLACYMVEGGGGGEFARVRRLLYTRPELLHRVLAINADAVAAYLAEQARHGADALMLFDTWGGLLSPEAYQGFSLAYIRRVLEQLRAEHPSVPTLVFARGAGQWLERIADSGCDAIGLDWTVDLAAARARVGGRVALQGNLDPQALRSTPAAIEAEARAILRAAGPAPGFVFNLGHGVVPDTPPDHVATLVDFVHAESRSRTHSVPEGKSAENRVDAGSAGS